MLDKYSSSDLANTHSMTERYIRALTKKAVDNGLKIVNIKGVEYKIGSRKSGKGYAYKPLKCEEVVNVVEVVEPKNESDTFSKFFDTKSFLNRSNSSCSEECTTTTISTTTPILGLDSDKTSTLEELSDDEKEKIFFKKKLLQEYETFEGTFSQFQEYIETLYFEELESFGINISYNQIKRFKEAHESNGVFGLIDRRGRAKGDNWKIKNWVTDELKSIFWAKKGDIRAKNLYRIINKEAYKRGEISKEQYIATLKGLGGVISYTRINEIIKELKSSREYKFLINPDRFKNCYLPAFGDAREKALYANHYWEIDSTQLDAFGVLGNKESTWQLISISDIKTAMKVVGVVKHSNAVAISELLYKAFNKLGIPEHIVTDNGKDYLSKHLEQLMEEWGIKHVRTAPFSGDQKPFVERHFGTIQNSFTELLRGFKGHSVAQFQSIKSQTSAADRLSGKAEKQAAESIEILATKLDDWIDNVYSREFNSSLKTSPYEAFLADEAHIKRSNIQNLAYAFCKKEIVKVAKKGIRKNNHLFNSQSGLLGNRVGDEIKIIIDPINQKQCFMFELDGRFIGIATNEKVTFETAIEAKQIYKAELKQVVNENRKIASKYKDRDFVSEIIETNKEVFSDAKPIELIGGGGMTQNSGNIERLHDIAKEIEKEVATIKEVKEKYVAWDHLASSTKESKKRKPDDLYEDIYLKKIAY